MDVRPEQRPPFCSREAHRAVGLSARDLPAASWRRLARGRKAGHHSLQGEVEWPDVKFTILLNFLLKGCGTPAEPQIGLSFCSR